MDPITPAETAETHHHHEHKEFFANPFFKWTVIILGELIIIIGVFALGIKVGRHEEHFGKQWIQNYPRNFGGPKDISIQLGAPDPTIQPHGLFGSILSKAKDNKSITIKGQDNVEKTVLIDGSTIIQKQFSTLKVQDLKSNDSVIVIGEPTEQGEVTAKFIRVLN